MIQDIEKAVILRLEWEGSTSEKLALAENGIVVVTTHLYDGRKSLPLDLELYQHFYSLAEGKQDPLFENQPELAIKLIDVSLSRGYQPRIVIVDAGYGNNTSFLLNARKPETKIFRWISESQSNY